MAPSGATFAFRPEHVYCREWDDATRLRPQGEIEEALAAQNQPDPRVVTKHEGASKAIALLRQAAAELKLLGDKCLDLDGRSSELADEIDDLYRRTASAETRYEVAEAIVSEWTDVLEDFKRGIRDRDELIERTVGR